MSGIKIQVRDNGPFLVSGDVEIVDADGKPFPVPDKPVIALCRCGASGNRPFCDGAHNQCEFSASERAPQ